MLKITIHDSPESIRLQLEGKLAGDWVQELERCWLRVRSTTQGRKIIVDLTDNDFVDENGKRLLATMHKDGAGFIAVTPLMIGVVAELTELCIGRPSRRCISGIVALLVSVAASAAIASAQPSPAARAPMRLSLGRAVQLAMRRRGMLISNLPMKPLRRHGRDRLRPGRLCCPIWKRWWDSRARPVISRQWVFDSTVRYPGSSFRSLSVRSTFSTYVHL